MGLGDMYQAQIDAEDAKRYRWLRNQYALGKQTYFAENCASDCSRNPALKHLQGLTHWMALPDGPNFEADGEVAK